MNHPVKHSSRYFIGSGFGTAVNPTVRQQDNPWLEVSYPQIEPIDTEQQLKIKLELHGLANHNGATTTPFEQQTRQPVVCFIDSEQPVNNAADAFLRLHLLSKRLCKPHEINLDGLFGKLHNIVWTNRGPVLPTDYEALQHQCMESGEWLRVFAVDKFPSMCDYVIPTGVRIANSANVRLGAYLGEGTTVMHAGFVNFNAGTLGESMVEGRISAGVTVDHGSDLGGASSTMGTLSGGNEVVISIGKNCLIGANAGTGIPLGDGCTIEAGCYITAGQKITDLRKGANQPIIKARELAGIPNLLLRRNAIKGNIECLDNEKIIQLNQQLHSNQ